jgi:hypothetical protein
VYTIGIEIGAYVFISITALDLRLLARLRVAPSPKYARLEGSPTRAML